MSYSIGPKIGIDGEKEFRQQIKDINDTYKALEAETKAVVKAFEAQGDEQGKLEALSKQLNKQIDEQKKKQSLLEDAVAKASAQFGEGSIEATRLRGALYDTQATISTLEGQLKDAKNQLEHFGEAMEDLESDEDLARKAMAQFQDQINVLNTKYKTLESETKAVTKSFEAQGDEQGKLEAVSKQLEKQIELQIQKQKTLESAIEKAADEFGEESIEATRLRGALYDTQATISTLESELKDTRTQLDKTGDAMEELENETESAGAAALDFGDVLGANLVSDMIMDGLRELASLVKDFAVGSVEAAAEVKAATAQYEQAFGDMQASATASLASISEDTNIASTRMQGSFTKIYSFAKTAGADSSEALTIASRAMVAAADSAAYYDASIEEATERLQAFLKGNYANDAALGIAATETTRNAKANELYAKSFKELTESQKVDTLLAMVEAGNQASGAIGQAARESDGWENVLGELAEVFRLIQAEAGKPALKKLTPIIQKITKSGYELIEDIDWDEFGETVESIAESVIDYGPGIVKAIASVAAGIAAFKISQKVIEFGQLATSFIGIGTQATAAGAAVAASGAVANATPWGLVASVIGLAVGTITALVLNAQNAQSDLEKVTDRLQESFQRAEETYQSTKTDVEGAAGAAEYYIGRLRELETEGLTTAAAHREYEMIVEQLNELIPELNLQIDEQTGLLTTNTDALLADVAAWKKNALAKALQDKFTDQIEAQAAAEAELITAQAKLNSLTDKQGDLSKELSRRREALNKTTRQMESLEDKLSDTRGMSSKEIEELCARHQALQESANSLTSEMTTLEGQMVQNNLEQETLNTDIAKATELVRSHDAAVAEAEAASALYTQQLAEESAATSELTDEQLAVKTSIENLIAAYDEAKATALESINSQIGLFEDLSGKSEWSAEKIIQNWDSQRLAFDNYTANLQKAVDLHLDETLVQQLSDGSVESMQILNALVNDTDLSVDAINAAFDRTSEAKDNMAGTMATIQTECQTKWNTIIQDAEDAGLDLVDGASGEIDRNSWKFTDALSRMATSGQNWWNKLWDRHSPSRWMGDASEDIVLGGVNEIDRNADLFADSMANLASYGKNAFLQEKLDLAVSYPDMVAAATSVTNNRSMVNMGGFNIQIYQQPGESATDLAYRVMDIIQTEVDAREAVFGAK